MSYKIKHRAKAFTLIEVTLSIGIVAFAFVAMMGMLPVGLSAYNNAVDATIEAQIAQKLFSEAQQIKFEDLDSISGGRFYDEEGGLINEGQTWPEQAFVYHARVSPPSADYVDNQYVRTITIEISKNRRVEDTATPHEIRKFTFVVANAGV